jgi:signal transduction histidine kinase
MLPKEDVLARVSLRTEIILNLVLLLGAALLLGGILLLKLVERELVTQRVGSAAAVMELLAGSGAGVETDLFRRVPQGLALEGWRAFSADLQPVAEGGRPPAAERADLLAVRGGGAVEARVDYPPAWLPFVAPPPGRVLVTVPVRSQEGAAVLLQAAFSLDDVRRRMATAQRVVLLYALLYGAVLVAFGVYLLGRTVVQPASRLQQVTRRVADGDLEQVLPVEGPREIAEVAGSFNAMVAALRQSRQESESLIASLRETNETLQRTRDDLVRSEKMASVGHLAAGMAHEIGNPLGAVVGYLGLLQAEAPEERGREIAERALAEAERIDRLVRELLDYAAPTRGEAETFDPAAALAEAARMLAHQGSFEGVTLEDALPPELPAVRMPRHRLLQVYVNLLLNARDACAPGGRIRLSGGERGGEVWLSVADDGAGMEPQVQAHVFDPFFTTKAPGRGRGLGLAVCLRIVEEAGGRIEIASAPGAGSTFTVRLSCAREVPDGR